MVDVIRLWWLQFWLRRDRARLARLEANRALEHQRVDAEYDQEKAVVEGAIQLNESALANIRAELAVMRASNPHK